MADRYVRSTDGNNADSGATWALAKADLAGVAAIDTAGDRIFVSQSHSESTASAVTISLAGTVNNPVQVLCGNDAAEPPTSLATGAQIITTGTNGITISGHGYFYGLDFIVADGGTSGSLTLCGSNDVSQVYENCSFQARGDSTRIGPNVNVATSCSVLRWKNCNVKFSSIFQRLVPTTALWYWDGGSVLPGSVTPQGVFENLSFSKMGMLLASGLDLSNLDSTVNLFKGRTVGVIRNSKLPASWTGSLYTGTATAGTRVEMHNCDSADTNYRVWIVDHTGELTQETTIVRSGGASDGVTPLSWKIATTANCNFLSSRFYSPEIVCWNDTVGSSVTVTVEIVHDSLTALNDDEIWLEIQYLGTSGYPLASFKSDAKADVLAAAAPQDSSSATWTTTGLTNPNKQKLSVSFVPQEKGALIAKVYLAKAGYTVYVDPMLAVA